MQNRKSLRKAPKKNKVVHSFPPQIPLKPVNNITLRFQASADITASITRRCVMCLFLTASSSTAANSYITIMSGVKLKRVEVWGSTATNDTTFGNVTVEWQDPRGPSAMVQDAGNPIRPPHVLTKPPKGSTAEMWSSFATAFLNETLFIITCQNNSVIDVTFNFVISNGAGTTTPNIEYLLRTTTAGPLVGTFATSLDNSSVAGSVGGNIIGPMGLTGAFNYTN